MSASSQRRRCSEVAEDRCRELHRVVRERVQILQVVQVRARSRVVCVRRLCLQTTEADDVEKIDELREVRDEPFEDQGFTHRLISRRLNHVYNSSGQELPALAERGTTNPAYLNPADLTAQDLVDRECAWLA